MGAIRRSLPDPETPKLRDLYESYLEASELRLAFECLVDAADSQSARPEVCNSLLGVGEAMEIHADDFPHGPALQRVLDHLSA